MRSDGVVVSSPPSRGIGSRATSSARQHVSARPQMNSVPQPEQASRRDGGFPNRFVMNRTESDWRFSCRVHVEQRYNSLVTYTPKKIQGKHKGKSDGPRFASRSGRAQSLRIWRARQRGGRFRQRGLRSARLCQSRTQPPQWGTARGARTVIDPGIGERGVCISAGGPASARRRGEIRRACVRGRAAIAGRQGAETQSFAQQHRHGDVGKRRSDEAYRKRQRHCSDGARRTDAAERSAAQRTKTTAAAAQHHSENLPRRGAGAAATCNDRRLRFRRAAGGVLVQPLLHFRQQGRAGADLGRLVRARGDPAACARAFRRHAQGGRAASGDAVLSRQSAIVGAGFPRRTKPQARPERKSRPRNHGAAYARRRRRLHPGRRDGTGAHHHRLDLCRTARTTRGVPGSFVFNANAHQPGAQRLLGKIYQDSGVAQGEEALADIARHPSTAKFITAKFARHFVADDPPPALVARLRDVFRKSDGDLGALTSALLNSDEAWQAPLTKLRNPYEFLVATGRLLAQIPEDPARYLGGLNVLGQPLWSPAGPNGFPDSNAAWAAPAGMKLRLDVSAQIASRLAANIDPRDLLQLAAADAASPETRRTIELAESRQQALALLLMSPEFQRR